MRARGVSPLLALALTCISACAQVLGLGDYGEAPEGGAGDATAEVDGAADRSLADPALDHASSDGGPFAEEADASDALPATSNDSGTDDRVDADAGAAQASDALADATVDTQTSDAPMDDAVDAQATDAPVDAAADAQATDAGFDACPTTCNGGCGDGGSCTINITSVMTGAVFCPPGLACQVMCAGTQVCPQPINCAAGQPCRVSCSGDEACTNGFINRGSATSLCVECLASGNPGCNSVTCTGMCTINCVGGCGGSCGNCTRVSSCP